MYVYCVSERLYQLINWTAVEGIAKQSGEEVDCSINSTSSAVLSVGPMTFRPPFYSSFFFLLPAFYAAAKGIQDVCMSCIMCLATSVVNHAYDSKHRIYRPLDIAVVNGTGLWYTLRGWFVLHPVRFALIIVFSTIAMLFYLLVSRRDPLGHAHVLVHVVAIAGVCLYIQGHPEQQDSNW